MKNRKIVVIWEFILHFPNQFDCEEMTRDYADPTSSGHVSRLQTFDAR